jgi:hydroxymethylpyrimidine pyrophosphatase-like HAD family hydrolase
LTNFDILTELSNRNLEIVTHEHTASLDLTSRNINKYTTFKKYFPTANYIAFGNDANDVELLKHADFSVAIGENSALDFADEHLKADEISEFLMRWEYKS